MADGILGLGTGQATTLNQELLEKLKSAERKSTVEPLETDLEDWDIESTKVAEIKLYVQDLLEAIKPFDLYVTSGVNAFEDKTATTTGDSVVFDAVDAGSLNTGTTTVNISSLAQRDVYQSGTFADKEAIISTTATDKITISGVEFSVYNKTYEELAAEINLSSSFNSSVEEVGTDTFRLVIKSENSGLDNALEIVEGGINLGLNQFTSETTIASGTIPSAGLNLTLNGTTFTTDGVETYNEFVQRIDADSALDASIVDGKVLIRNSDGSSLDVTSDDLSLNMLNNNNTLKAQNLQATIDGVSYNVSSNTITVDGELKITAVKEGSSTISIEKDTTNITTVAENFIEKYNTLFDTINTELYSSDSSIEDRSTLRTLISQIKDQLFNNYGSNSDLNVFNYGFTLDKSGVLSLDSTVFNTAVNNDFDNLKNLFIGTAESEGFGTQLKTYVDGLDGFDGLITAYEDNLSTRKTNLEDERDKAIEDLDSKYLQLSEQFADYGAIITKFNSQFSGLEMMIAQSISS